MARALIRLLAIVALLLPSLGNPAYADASPAIAADFAGTSAVPEPSFALDDAGGDAAPMQSEQAVANQDSAWGLGIETAGSPNGLRARVNEPVPAIGAGDLSPWPASSGLVAANLPNPATTPVLGQGAPAGATGLRSEQAPAMGSASPPSSASTGASPPVVTGPVQSGILGAEPITSADQPAAGDPLAEPAAGSIVATFAWTADPNGSSDSSFAAGDSMRWYGRLNNTTGASRSVYVRYGLRNACGTFNLWSGNLVTAAENQSWYLDGAAVCAGTHTFTFSATYGGTTTSKSVTYAVSGSGTVSAYEAMTTDGSGTAKTTFAAGDSIRWHAQVLNSTSGDKSFSGRWQLATPCGTSTLWQGSLSAALGYSWRYHSGKAICPGTHRLTFYSTYSDSTTAAQFEYSVTGTGTVTADSAWASDSGGTRKSAFSAGSSIRWNGGVLNSTVMTQTVTARWALTTPCGTATLWEGDLTPGAGYPSWYVTGKAACPGKHTLRFYATYNGATTAKSATYTVTGTGSVSASDAWVADGDGNEQSTFAAGDTILWYGMAFNSTTGRKTISARWSLSSPCGTSNLWSGDLAANTGYPWWSLSGKAACPGTHTLTFYSTYKGTTTSQSATYTVSGEGSASANDAWAADASGNRKASFVAGDGMRWYGQVFNSTVTTQTVATRLDLTTPCEESTLWQTSREASTGYPGWYLSGNAACPGRHVLRFHGLYGGVTTSQAFTYTVTGTGSVSANSAWTAADDGATRKTTFAVGEEIRWTGKILNSTSSTKSVNVKFHLRTPCGSSYQWQGSRTAGAIVRGSVYQYAGTASCPGTHTFTFYVTYNGVTTSKSVSYRVTS